jgi:OOP family OmpA-OmpF porin
VVRSAGKEVLLDRAYAAADVGKGGSFRLDNIDAQIVEKRYASTLQAVPPRPAAFIVRFLTGRDDALTDDSVAVFEELKAFLRSRSTPAEIRVTGHTDRVGTVKDNDALSLERAKFVRDALVTAGIKDALSIEVAGRGEREPLVPTEDEVPNAQNRRVVIEVR